MIKLYALSTCNHCKTLKEMLAAENRPFDAVDVDLLTGKERRDMIEEVREVNKRVSFPTLVVGDTVIVGFKQDEVKKALEAIA